MYAHKEVYSIGETTGMKDELISFSNKELVGIKLPRDDPMVIALIIVNFTVEIMLVNTDSTADILYLNTFDKLRLPRSLIKQLHTPLTGFTGHTIHAVGEEHSLEKSTNKKLIALVREYEDVFAWGPEDILGIDPKVAVHKLYVDSTFQPIKQKKWLFNDEKNKAIREEVQKLLKADAIRELKFPNWIANVVLGSLQHSNLHLFRLI
ncbi:hypothetical protein LIER_17887 [Lithospermum erythrorhizon]|uniref:Uncharacterized protein n=1 Tax=Lithospermum erythrorhizon TaxID=34254 RepID=A0AAV3QER8_LITER